MKRQLTVLGFFSATAVLYYLKLFALVDVITFGLSFVFIFTMAVFLLVACLIREGEVLEEDAYNLFNDIDKNKKPKHVRIFNWFLIFATLIYINAPVTLGSALSFYICGTMVLKYFKSFEWSEDRVCVRKLEKGEK